MSKRTFGICSKKITFDLTHEWQYISAGSKTEKSRNEMFIVKLSTTFSACYSEAIYYNYQALTLKLNCHELIC